MANQENHIIISPEILARLDDVIKASLEYQKVTDYYREIGLTGEAGEILTCNELDLYLLSDKITTGYDAVDTSNIRFQIKTKRSNRKGEFKGNFGVFSQSLAFDYALFVFLTFNYEI